MIVLQSGNYFHEISLKIVIIYYDVGYEKDFQKKFDFLKSLIKKRIKTIKNLNFNGEPFMQIKNIKLNQANNVFHGELNFVDDELSKDNCQEMIYKLLSWKLGPLEPTRHFELSYNSEKGRVEVEVFVSVTKPKPDDLDTAKYVFSKLIEFTTIYHKELEELKTSEG